MIILRRALTTDAGTVGGILSEFAEMTPWMPQIYTRAQDVAHAGLIIDLGWVMLAERDAEVVGFAACDGAELNALYVARIARNQGVGSTLLYYLCRERPFLTLWTFQANEAAQKFYLRHGFFEVLRTDGAGNDERLPDIRFEWRREAA